MSLKVQFHAVLFEGQCIGSMCTLHPSIFCHRFSSTEGHWGAAASPSCLGAKAGLHLRQVASLSQGHKDTNNLLHSPIRVLLPISGFLAARRPSRPLNHCYITVTYTHGFKTA